MYKGDIDMAISVRLSEDFVRTAKMYGEANHRSLPKQIEYWSQIGRIAEDNPELSYEFIREALLATAEVNLGSVQKYVRSKQY